MDTYMDTKPSHESNRDRGRLVTRRYEKQNSVSFPNQLAERMGNTIPCVYRVQGRHADEDWHGNHA
jgi:hypothetical protein